MKNCAFLLWTIRYKGQILRFVQLNIYFIQGGEKEKFINRNIQKIVILTQILKDFEETFRIAKFVYSNDELFNQLTVMLTFTEPNRYS